MAAFTVQPGTSFHAVQVKCWRMGRWGTKEGMGRGEDGPATCNDAIMLLYSPSRMERRSPSWTLYPRCPFTSTGSDLLGRNPRTESTLTTSPRTASCRPCRRSLRRTSRA